MFPQEERQNGRLTLPEALPQVNQWLQSARVLFLFLKAFASILLLGWKAATHNQATNLTLAQNSCSPRKARSTNRNLVVSSSALPRIASSIKAVSYTHLT